MSDGMMDAKRDQERVEAKYEWLRALAYALEHPEDLNADAQVATSAEAVENIRGGYWSGQAHGFSTYSKRLLEQLRSGNAKAWDEILKNIEVPLLRHKFQTIREDYAPAPTVP